MAASDSSNQWVLPSTSATSVLVPEVSHSRPPPQETLQDQQVGLTQAAMKSLLFPLGPSLYEPCVCPLRIFLQFTQVLWSSCHQAPLAFKDKCSGGSSSWYQTSRLRSLMWGSELSLLWENLCNIIILKFVGCPPGRYRILSSHCDFFFVFGCKICFLVVSSPFLSMVVQQVVVILVFLWEEVGSGPPTLPFCQESHTFTSDFSYLHLLSFFFVSIAEELPILFIFSKNLLFIDSIVFLLCLSPL